MKKAVTTAVGKMKKREVRIIGRIVGAGRGVGALSSRMSIVVGPYIPRNGDVWGGERVK